MENTYFNNIYNFNLKIENVNIFLKKKNYELMILKERVGFEPIICDRSLVNLKCFVSLGGVGLLKSSTIFKFMFI